MDTPKESFLLGLYEGRLIHATGDTPPDGQRLGEILIELGFLSANDLEGFLIMIISDISLIKSKNR